MPVKFPPHSKVFIVGISAFVVISIFFPYLAQIILVVFTSILLAILLRYPANWLSKRTRIPEKWAFGLTVVLILGIFGLIGWLVIPQVVLQVNQFVGQIPDVVEKINQTVRQYEWARQILDRPLQIPDVIPGVQSVESMLSRISNIFSGTFGLLTNILIILVLGVYLAFEPDIYTQGFVKLLPPESRERAKEILSVMGNALQWWLIGRFIAMIILGVLVGVGIALIGMPLALGLGIITGLLSFVPVIGSILAVIPAMLIALAQEPIYVLYVVLLYLAAQGVETYLLTPFVQRKTVLMPPATALIIQLFLGILIGPLGVALAYPIAVVGQVLVKTMYIEDVLNETVDIIPG